MIEEKDRSKRVILYTGKGGTGKSVIACATGLRTAALGYETLVMSADPSHTLADAFGRRIEDEPEKVSEHLWGLHIDSVREMKKSYSVIQDYIVSVLSAKGIEETLAYEIASLPTMTHVFALLRIEDFLKKEDFDVLILDTVPSGEALRYLYFPRLIGSVTKKLMKLMAPFTSLVKIVEPVVGVPAPSKKVVTSEIELISRLEGLAKILTDPKITSLRLIANPDFLSIENMRRTLMVSNLYGINVDLAIINKVLPEEVVDPYFVEWKALQEKSLKEAEANFYPLPIKKLKLFQTELRGFSMLVESSEALFKDEDPTQRYFKGETFRTIYGDDTLSMIVSVPFTEKDRCEVERVGDELIVKVETGVGSVVNVVPLPAATLDMALSRAQLRNNELHIQFTKGQGK